MDWTLFIIKPEAFSKREEIKKNIDTSGNLRVKHSLVSALTEQDISYLASEDAGYSARLRLFNAYSHYMRAGFVEIGLLEGPSAVEDFKKLCGTLPDPKECMPETLRWRFGDHTTQEYEGTLFCLNGIHKPNNMDEALHERALYEDLKMRPSYEVLKEMVFREYSLPPHEAHPAFVNEGKMLWEKHIMPAADYAGQLSHLFGADKEVALAAAYAHDRARLQGDDLNHHLTGADMTRKDLEIIGAGQEYINRVCDCIIHHRGSIMEEEKLGIEEQIVRSADGMSSIANPSLLWYSATAKHGLRGGDAKQKVLQKMQREYQKIMPEAKPLIDEQYEASLKWLESI